MYKRFLDLIDNVDQKILLKSLNNVHSSDIFSLVLDGESGNLTRVFFCNKVLKPFDVQFHTHRYPVVITPISGNIVHHRAYISRVEVGTLKIQRYKYSNAINGDNKLTEEDYVNIRCEEYNVPIGSCFSLGVNDYHTMSCSEGSIWIVEEKGYEKDHSYVLGVPFKTNNLYDPATKKEIQKHFSILKLKLNQLI